MKRKRFIVFFAAVLIFLMSCGESEPKNILAVNGSEINAEPDNAGPEPDIAAEDLFKDDLGEFDFDGYVFTFMTRDVDFINVKIDFEELTGEILEDAIFERNRRIEERFNIIFRNPINYDSNRVRNSIRAGDNEYDVVMTRNADAFTTFAMEGLIHGLDNFTYIDLDKPYWDMNVTNELSVANKRFFTAGAFNLSAYDFVHVLIFNKNLLADYGLKDPYEMVKNGSWTFEAYEEMAKGATRSLTGGGPLTRDDAFGFLSAPKQVLPCFWISSGLKSIGKDADGIPYSMMTGERFFEVFERIFAMTWDNDSWFANTWGENIPAQHLEMFQNNQALFMNCTFFYLASLRNMESDFGILPYPKYNAQQEKYYSRMEGCDLFFAPISAPQEALDRTSVILEALASDSAANVVPVYYELALKTKFTRDEESAEILDLLFENRIFDLGDTAWGDRIRDPIFAPMFQSNNRNLASRLESIERTVDQLIERTVEAFERLD